MSVTEDILSRISKLLMLAGDKGATEAEAQTALEMAHKLLEAHNLNMSQVEEAHGQKQKRESVDGSRMMVGKWEVTPRCTRWGLRWLMGQMPHSLRAMQSLGRCEEPSRSTLLNRERSDT